MITKWTVWYREHGGSVISQDLWNEEQVRGYLQALQNIGIKPTNCGYSRAKVSAITGLRHKIIETVN